MTSIIAFLILIGVLITAHELGHMIVAKLCGVRVHTFSVGFGRPIISKQWGETEYRISLLPLGGYVRLHGMEREFGEHEELRSTHAQQEEDEYLDPDAGRSLQDKPAWMRVLIFLAGPGMNLLLPFLLLPPLFYWSNVYHEVIDAQMGSIDEGLPAYRAGLRDGDRILTIDGEPIYAFWQIQQRVNAFEEGDSPLLVRVARPTEEEAVEVSVTPERVASTERLAQMVRRPPRIGYQPASLASDYVVSNQASLFAAAGGQSFDRIIEVDGQKVARHSEVISKIGQYLESKKSLGDLTIPITVERFETLDERWSFLRVAERHVLHLKLKPLTDRYQSLYRNSSQRMVMIDRPSMIAQSLGVRQASACISSINPESAAAEVLKVGDCLLEVDGDRHSLAVFFNQRLRHQPDQPKKRLLLRDGQEVEKELHLREATHRDALAGEVHFWQLGFTMSGLSRVGALIPPQLVDNQDRLSFAWAQTKRRVYDELTRSLHSLSGLFSGSVSPTQLSGPITIFYLAGRQAEAGWEAFIHLMVLISLSIALLNLLPIPGLDGGHIMFAGLEMIARRPLPVKFKVYIQTAGVLLILTLILFALGNDLVRMWRLSQGG